MTSDTLDYKHGQELPSYNKWYHFQTERKKKENPNGKMRKATKENGYHIKRGGKQNFFFYRFLFKTSSFERNY